MNPIPSPFEIDQLWRLVEFLNRPWTVDDKTVYVTLPEGSGLGFDINREKMAQVAVDPRYKWRWLGSKMCDGSLADY